MATTRELLLAERARARERVAGLEREFAGLAEAASAATPSRARARSASRSSRAVAMSRP